MGKIMRQEVVNLSKFDINELYPPNQGTGLSICLLGMRSSGKSVNIGSLCYDTRNRFGSVYFFSPTADLLKQGKTAFGNIFQRAYCFERPKPGQLERLMKFQQYIKRIAPSILSEYETDCLVILDDLSVEKKVVKNEELDKFTCTARHYGITTIVSAQYLNHLSTTARENCDIFMTNFIRNQKTKKKLFDEVFSMFPNFSTFDDTLSKVTQITGRSLVCISGKGVKDKSSIAGCTFYYRSRFPIPDFTMSCRISRIINRALGKSEEQITLEMQKLMEEDMKKNEIELKEEEYGRDNTEDVEAL